MKPRRTHEAASVDGRRLRTVAEALGASRLAELLVIFEARIAWLEAALGAVPADLPALLTVLHQSRGSAASLGFNRLNTVLMEIEQQLRPAVAPAGQLPSGAALGVAWQASLAAAALQIPELLHHRPFGSNR